MYRYIRFDLCPYQALRTLVELDKDEGYRYEKARKILRKRMYTDDVYGGADNLTGAKQVRKDFTDLLKAGGFPLGKSMVNHAELLEDVPPDQLSPMPLLNFNMDEPHSVLGINWLPTADTFTYKVNWSTQETKVITKKHFLSQSARLYDPLGWISPITIAFKVFLQALWQMGAQWDDALPLPRQKEWMELIKDLKDISKISIPRRICLAESQTAMELHGFADATERRWVR